MTFLNKNISDLKLFASFAPLREKFRFTTCFAIILFIMCTGCARKTTTVVIRDNKKETTITHTTSKTKTAPAPEEAAPVTVEKKPAKKEFHIALLLPLFLNSMNVDSGKSPVVGDNSKIGLDYYQGALLALDSLKAKGFNAVMHVFDCENGEEKVKQLLAKGMLENEDLIIGPVYNSQARLVAEMAKKKGIPMLSPLSPSDNITTGNPDFMMANPPLDVHCEALFHFATESFSNANFILLYPINGSDEKYVGLLNDLAEKKKIKLINVSVKKGQDSDIKTYLSKTKKNVVFIPSMDLPFLVSVSKELNTQSADHDITVMGMPIWGTDENLRMDYINALKVHFTSPFYVQPEFYNPKIGLCKAFVDRFGNAPSENAIKGYDQVKYFGALLLKNGAKFGEKMLKDETHVNYTAFAFRLHKTVDAAGRESVDFVENKFVNILRYQDRAVKLIPQR